MIANNLIKYTDTVLSGDQAHHGLSIFLAGFFFYIRVFFDFAAYSDIAIGISRIMGIKLSKNFGHHPFFSSPTHHWKEWHITLTDWFRDYVYFPLTRHGTSKNYWYFCLLITFLITGLWHGASWGFIAWGGIHGLYLVTDQRSQALRKKWGNMLGINKYPILINSLSKACFIFMVILATFFFATDFSGALTLIRSMFIFDDFLNLGTNPMKITLMTLAVIGTSIFGYVLGKKSVYEYLGHRPGWFRWLFYIVIIYSILFFRGTETEFVYFEF